MTNKPLDFQSILSEEITFEVPIIPKRFCPCGTILSRYNSENLCHVCLRKKEREERR